MKPAPSVSTGLPFAVVLLVMCASLLLGLKAEMEPTAEDAD
jgi:choline-glycine betaine transporter